MASENGATQQLKAIRIAKKVGVKLFVPCDYSLEFSDIAKTVTPHVDGKVLAVKDHEHETYPLIRLREEAEWTCKEVGLPCLRVFLGMSEPLVWWDCMWNSDFSPLSEIQVQC
jgi:hypothetical protein